MKPSPFKSHTRSSVAEVATRACLFAQNGWTATLASVRVMAYRVELSIFPGPSQSIRFLGFFAQLHAIKDSYTSLYFFLGCCCAEQRMPPPSQFSGITSTNTISLPGNWVSKILRGVPFLLKSLPQRSSKQLQAHW